MSLELGAIPPTCEASEQPNAAPRALALWRSIRRLRVYCPAPKMLGAAVLLAIAYAGTARIGEMLAFPSAPVSALWAPNAILMAALLVARRRDWWLLLLCILPGHVLVQLWVGVSPTQVAIQYIANCCTALLGAGAFRLLLPDVERIDRIYSGVAFIVLCVILAPVLSSVLMAAAFFAFGLGGDFWLTVAARSLTNAFAIVTLVPLAMEIAAFAHQADHPIRRGRAVEGGLFLASVLLLVLLAYTNPSILIADFWALIYALFVIVLWAATRFGVGAVCLSALTLGVLATWGMLNRAEPFVGNSPVGNAIWLLLFVVATCIALLLLAVAFEERKLLEQASSASEARFRTIFSANIIPTIIWRADGRIVDANESFYTLTGYGGADLLTGALRADRLLNSPAEVDRLRIGPSPSVALAGGASEQELVCRDGNRIPVLVGGSPFPGSRTEGTAYVFDLSVLRRAEAERAEAVKLHRAVMGSFQDQILVLDQAGTVIEANAAWRRLAEHTDNPPYERAAVGDSFAEICRSAVLVGDTVAAELLESILDVLSATSARRRIEFSRDSPTGLSWREISVEPLRRTEGGVVITRTDISAQKRAAIQAQEQRQQLGVLSRAAVLGELSGAFAHELAQPLTSILGNAEAALEICARGSGSPEIEDILRDIVRDDVRAAEVIQRLRSMLARGEIERRPIDLNQIVRDVLALAHSDLVTRNVIVNLHLEPRASPVMADAVQLQQVLLNLVVNACDAMSANTPEDRRVTIDTRPVENGQSIECAVSDRGTGIGPTDLERIFTPFFTTKKRGLGLGLAICRSIIEAHGGRLWAENGSERGAVFRFTVGVGP